MRFKSLGSGSSGNALIIEKQASDGQKTRVLVDCGFTQKELISRLAQIQLSPNDLSAIFITHEHSDHVGCAPSFSKKWGIPLWMSEGTALSLKNGFDPSNTHFASDAQAFNVGCLRLTPFTVPHDAREPLQIKIDDGRRQLAIVTDLGTVTDYVIQNIYKCHALVLESNHEPHLLAQSSYPAHIKKRVGGSHGHLSNQHAIDLLREIKHADLQHVVAAHLSEQNNEHAIVAEYFSKEMHCSPENICIATPEQGTQWLNIQ